MCIAAGNMIGRILAVNAVDRISVEGYRTSTELTPSGRNSTHSDLPADRLQRESTPRPKRGFARSSQQRPFLSGNDRSRWDTIRSLVEHGTYQIDDIVSQPNWDTIDMVKHADKAGKKHLYSSKPPLLATLMAGEYWLINKITGKTLGTHPYEIGRFMLITINVLPLLVYFWLLARMVERYGRTDWGRMFMVAAACFGTFLTTFAIMLNNHMPAAVCAAIALYAVLRIWYDGERGCVFCAGRFLRGVYGAGRIAAVVLRGVDGGATGSAAANAARLCAGRAAGDRGVLRHELLANDRCCQPTSIAAKPASRTTGTTSPGTSGSATAAGMPSIPSRVRSTRKVPATAIGGQGSPEHDRPGRADHGRLCFQRAGRPSRHLFAHADLAAEDSGLGSALRRRAANDAGAGLLIAAVRLSASRFISAAAATTATTAA